MNEENLNLTAYQEVFDCKNPEQFKFCPNCKYPLKPSTKHPDFKECSNEKCQILYRFRNFVSVENIDQYYKIYDDEEKIIRELTSDLGFYRNQKNTLDIPFQNLNLNHFDKVIAFGGGYPKLETALNLSDNIIVYDFLADVYEKHQEKFFNIFRDFIAQRPNYKLEYRKEFVDSKNIAEFVIKEYQEIEKENKKILITFVHIFEHLFYKDFISTLKSLIKNIPEEIRKNIYILIYQPNVETALNQNWFHFRPIEHVLFVPLKTYVIILSLLGIDVYSYMTIANDLYIVGRLY